MPPLHCVAHVAVLNLMPPSQLIVWGASIALIAIYKASATSGKYKTVAVLMYTAVVCV